MNAKFFDVRVRVKMESDEDEPDAIPTQEDANKAVEHALEVAKFDWDRSMTGANTELTDFEVIS